MTNSFLLAGLLLAFIATSATSFPASKSAGVHHIKAQHIRVPDDVAEQLRKNLKPSDLLKTKWNQDDAAGTSTGHSSTLPLEDYYQYVLIGNVSVGTPAQTLRLGFDFYSQDLYVIGKGADVDESEEVGEASKNQYDSSASTTYTPDATNRSFSAVNHYATGVAVSDIVNLAGLSVNLTFGDISTVGSIVSALPLDGFIGLRDTLSYNNISNVLQQLVGSLDEPVITYHTNRSYSNYNDTHQAEVVFGSKSVDFCQDDWVISNAPANKSVYQSKTSFRLSSIGANVGGCQSSLASNHSLVLYNYFYPLYVSYQALELFVQASGATFNTSTYGYELPCEQVANAYSVQFNVDAGQTLTITPADYIIQYNNKCSLYVSASYDEHNPRYNSYDIILGQQFLNNHCLSYNIQDQTVGLATAKTIA